MRRALRLLRSDGWRLSSQLHSQRGLSLTEVIVALTITALILAGAVRMITSWSTATRTFPVAGARGASDAQVQQMIAELRNTIAVSFISQTEVVAGINTAANYPNPPVVNGTPTGAYPVAYFYAADTHTLYRNGSGAVGFNGPAGGWQVVADNLVGLSFTGYDVNMNQTTVPSQVSIIGITVQYQGLPPEQEILSLRGTSKYTASYSHQLTIPPQSLAASSSSGTSAISAGGSGGGNHSGSTAPPSSPEPAGVASVTGPDGFNASVSFGIHTPDMVEAGNPAFASGVSGSYSGTSIGYATSTLDAAAAAIKAAIDNDVRNIEPHTVEVENRLQTALQNIADRLSAGTPEAPSPPSTSADESRSTGDTSSGGSDRTTGGLNTGDSNGGGASGGDSGGGAGGGGDGGGGGG